LQDLDQQINSIESSSSECLQRSSQLFKMLSELSHNSLFKIAETTNITESCSLHFDMTQIGQASAEECNQQQCTSSVTIEHRNRDTPLTKLQRMLASSGSVSSLSSKFVPSSLKNESIEHLLFTSEDAAPNQIDPQVQDTEIPSDHLLEQPAATHNSAITFSSKNDPLHQESACNFEPQKACALLAEVPDGPSQRAAFLLLSRSSRTVPLSPRQSSKQNVCVKPKHWDGSDLCDDPYVCIYFSVVCPEWNLIISHGLNRFISDGLKYIPSMHSASKSDSIKNMLERAPLFAKFPRTADRYLKPNVRSLLFKHIIFAAATIVPKAQVIFLAFSKLVKEVHILSLGTILLGSASVCKMEMGLLRPGSSKSFKSTAAARPCSAFLSLDTLPRSKNAPWTFEFNAKNAKY
jgi:hypothetical protein